jgi:hypothetical protein
MSFSDATSCDGDQGSIADDLTLGKEEDDSGEDDDDDDDDDGRDALA